MKTKTRTVRIALSLMMMMFFSITTIAQTSPSLGGGTGVVTVTASGGSCLAFTPSQSGGPDNWEVAEGGSYIMTISGVTECAGGTITVFVQSSNTSNFCFDATEGNPGVYTGSFTMPDQACYTMPISYKC